MQILLTQQEYDDLKARAEKVQAELKKTQDFREEFRRQASEHIAAIGRYLDKADEEWFRERPAFKAAVEAWLKNTDRLTKDQKTLLQGRTWALKSLVF